jgi:integrase
MLNCQYLMNGQLFKSLIKASPTLPADAGFCPVTNRPSTTTSAHDIGYNNRIFPISYVAAWSIVRKSGNLVNIELRPHDSRRHAATYASRPGTPIEIVSKVILRHADLWATQRYLGKVNDSEAIRWIETLYG